MQADKRGLDGGFRLDNGADPKIPMPFGNALGVTLRVDSHQENRRGVVPRGSVVALNSIRVAPSSAARNAHSKTNRSSVAKAYMATEQRLRTYLILDEVAQLLCAAKKSRRARATMR